MAVIDPTVTWRKTEERLAVETDPVLRRNLELLLQHQKAEATLDMESLMATVSEKAYYQAFGGGHPPLEGKAAVRKFYEDFAASGAHITWRRFVAVAAAGVGAVAAVGVLDWLRPADERSHLGRFVAQVVDGSAWETLARKAGYALRSVLGGVPVWITLVVLVAAALLLFAPRRFTPVWFARTEAAWPLLRPTVLALWIVCVAGSVVNDFGVRIALIALIPAVPLLTVAALHATDGLTDGDARQDRADAVDADATVEPVRT